ncbi:MAG: hypothetical protein H6737_24905 [Alphaproteobacteria bacterium]|nr:hypothetical protein [Alphaproteobacteria bacterium]
MPTSPPFVLSQAVQIEMTEDTLNIKHDGDVVIEQTLGRSLGTIEVGGDLTIRLPVIGGTLRAGGVMRLEGVIDADTLHAGEIEIGTDDVKCKAISADASITIGAADLKVDAIIAPQIDVDPNASGRVTVIESHNERPATKIKGGFSLADYGDMFGDAESFLAERGLAPLGEASAAPAKKPSRPKPVAKIDAPKPKPVKLPEEENVALAPTMADEEDDEEEVDDPLSLSLDDLEPLVEKGGEKGDMQVRLQDALKRITACYEGTDVPPAVKELRSLIDDGDMDALKSNITEVWNGLLGFHQKRGIRPHHQVTHAFNVIHSLVS